LVTEVEVVGAAASRLYGYDAVIGSPTDAGQFILYPQGNSAQRMIKTLESTYCFKFSSFPNAIYALKY